MWPRYSQPIVKPGYSPLHLILYSLLDALNVSSPCYTFSHFVFRNQFSANQSHISISYARERQIGKNKAFNSIQVFKMFCIKRRFRYVKAFNVRIVFSSYTETYSTFTCELSNFFIFWKSATENFNADKFSHFHSPS
nr:MAG TPA: hypothetical protein [Caudoviricetes sp.]